MKHLKWTIGLALALVMFTPSTPVKAQDCQTLLTNYANAQYGYSASNTALGNAQLVIAGDILAGLGPGDPEFDQDMNQVINLGNLFDMWNQMVDDTYAEAHAYHCM